MSRLDEILRAKRDEIEALRPRREELRRTALLRNDFRGFAAALQREEGKLALIAEIKKASPSAGVIVESFDPVAIAKNYARAGVDVDLGNRVKRNIQARVKSTHGPEVLGKVGGFGGLFAPNFSGMRDPVLVAASMESEQN